MTRGKFLASLGALIIAPFLPYAKKKIPIEWKHDATPFPQSVQRIGHKVKKVVGNWWQKYGYYGNDIETSEWRVFNVKIPFSVIPKDAEVLGGREYEEKIGGHGAYKNDCIRKVDGMSLGYARNAPITHDADGWYITFHHPNALVVKEGNNIPLKKTLVG